MQTTLFENPARRGLPAAHAIDPASCAHPRAAEPDPDDDFVAMLGAYRCSGGLARADEVVSRLEQGRGPGLATLARWVVERNVISFEWRGETWLPWFQFKPAGHVPAPALVAVLAELSAVYDGWELAHWFARPNSALAGRTPVDVIGADADAVRQAARADRFVAKG